MTESLVEAKKLSVGSVVWILQLLQKLLDQSMHPI